MLIALTSLTEFIRFRACTIASLSGPCQLGFLSVQFIWVIWLPKYCFRGVTFALLWCGFVFVILNWSENNIAGGNKRHQRLYIPLLCKATFIHRESSVVLKRWLKRLCCYFGPTSFIILCIKRAHSVFANGERYLLEGFIHGLWLYKQGSKLRPIQSHLRLNFFPLRLKHLLPLPFRNKKIISCQFAATLRTVPTIVIAHTFCASPDTRISYRQCLVIKGYFCAI